MSKNKLLQIAECVIAIKRKNNKGDEFNDPSK